VKPANDCLLGMHLPMLNWKLLTMELHVLIVGGSTKMGCVRFSVLPWEVGGCVLNFRQTGLKKEDF
jgi:hypothetical protein